jgi:(1->4)-alpha-D-glucan 1-alpha-D-glucosylmutase
VASRHTSSRRAPDTCCRRSISLRVRQLDGLHIDHPDGLRDPEEYLDRLRAAAPHGWIVVEKILEPGEPLPESWPVAGTTGYDFLNRVAGLFIDPAAEEVLSECYGEFTGARLDYGQLVHDAKLTILREVLGSDVKSAYRPAPGHL